MRKGITLLKNDATLEKQKFINLVMVGTSSGVYDYLKISAISLLNLTLTQFLSKWITYIIFKFKQELHVYLECDDFKNKRILDPKFRQIHENFPNLEQEIKKVIPTNLEINGKLVF